MLISLCILVLLISSTVAWDPFVSTWSGVVRGREGLTVGQSHQYFSFQGIPYAEPPVGLLRFEPPVPKSRWEGVWNATQDGSRCIQGSDPVDGSEDCLFINVYTPRLPDYGTPLLPVMVWIHGGGFAGGDSTYENAGPDYLLEKQVVVVSLNYRLGILGFLSTGDTVVPGNNGLKDQILGLKWVQENIRRFGGNPKDVTIFGQSAGAASISYLVQSPLTAGLFHKAILQSGVSLTTWGLSKFIPSVAAATATKAGLDSSSSQSIVAGLRSLNVTYLQQTASISATDHYLTGNNFKDKLFAFGPCAEPEHDGAVFTKKSHEMLKNGEFNRVPIIVGYNSLEGTFTGGSLNSILFIFDIIPSLLVTRSLNIASVAAKSALGREIKTEYFGTESISQSEQKAMEYISDDMFNRPIREFVKCVRPYVPVYFYRFSYEGNLWGITERPYPGVTHSEELGYIFRSRFESTATEDDILTRERMTSLWVNFAKTGNPTPEIRETVLSDILWDVSDEHYTHIDIGPQVLLSQYPQEQKMAYWDELFAQNGVPPYETY